VKGLLTIKARNRDDLNWIRGEIDTSEIEESETADYRFRVKADRLNVINLTTTILYQINYPKTKPKLAERHPERNGIYFRVWDDLCAIQELDDGAA